MSKTDKLSRSLLSWQGFVFVMLATLAAQIYYRQMADHSASFLLFSIVAFGAPAIVLAIIAFGVGRHYGIREGFGDGLTNGKYQGEYTIELLRKQLKERDRRLALAATTGPLSGEGQRGGDTLQEAPGDTSELLLDPQGKLLPAALMVQYRYWHPDRFNPKDADTMPARRDILEWIKEQWPWMSGAEAEAVEKVACPVKR